MKSKLCKTLGCLLVAIAGPFGANVRAASGDLDPTFGDNGIVTTAIGSGTDQAYSAALQSDGKIVVAGTSHSGTGFDFALVRYNPNGSVDTSFNETGKVTTDFGGYWDTGRSVAVQGDGKIVLAGTSYDGSNFVWALARYNADGTLDTSFNGTGKVTTDFSSREDAAFSVAIQSDGKIVVAGYSGDPDFTVARYNADGSLDTSFNGTGKVTTAIVNSDYGQSVALQDDGKVIVAGYSQTGSTFTDFALVRYTADGSLDTSFNGTGKVTTDFASSSDIVNAMALQSDGKVVIAGYSYTGLPGDFALARYTSDGALDIDFNGTGKVITSIGSGYDFANSVAIQSDGKVIVAGQAQSGSDADFAVVRYNTDGSLDTSFNATGKVITAIGSDDSSGHDILLQSDGKIVVVGYASDGSLYDFAMVRYQGIPVLEAEVQPPINADGTSIFNAKRGVVPVKFTLSVDGVVTCDLPPATISVRRTADVATGAINEPVYSLAADTGPDFRIEDCQYTYNLSSKPLGVGAYLVDIEINGRVMGSGVFQLEKGPAP